MRGTIRGLMPDYERRGNYLLSLSVNGADAKALEELKENDLDISIKKHREKRTLDQNRYYWELLGQLAYKLNVSNNRMHNLLLRRYGTLESVGGQVAIVDIPDTESAENDVLEAVTYHLRPTSKTRTDKEGNSWREYLMIKGSSSYDTLEMTKLLNGLKEECISQGIQVMTPEEERRFETYYR